jgi:hypothetical protein
MGAQQHLPTLVEDHVAKAHCEHSDWGRAIACASVVERATVARARYRNVTVALDRNDVGRDTATESFL